MIITEVKGSSVTAQNNECSVFRDASQFRRVVDSDSGDDQETPAAIINQETRELDPSTVETEENLTLPDQGEAGVAGIPANPAESPSVAERRSRRNVQPPTRYADYAM